MRKYRVCEPNWDLPEDERFRIDNTVETILSEKEIVSLYWDCWTKARGIQSEYPICYESCLQDWVCSHWAVLV